MHNKATASIPGSRVTAMNASTVHDVSSACDHCDACSAASPASCSNILLCTNVLSHLDTSTSTSAGRRPHAIEYSVMYALPSTASRPSTLPPVVSKLRRVMTWNSCSTCKGGYSANDGPPSTICPQSKVSPMHIILATSATHVRRPTCNAAAVKTPDKCSSVRASSGSTSCTSRCDKRCLPR